MLSPRHSVTVCWQWLALAAALNACGTGPGAPDAGADGTAADIEGELPRVAPASPRLPSLPSCLQGQAPAGCAAPPRLEDWTCPPGWSPSAGITDEHGDAAVLPEVKGFSICRPPTQQQCPAGTAQFLGEESCARIGAACPAADFLAEEQIRALAGQVTGPILYARPGAAGDGTRKAPLGTLAAALAAAPGSAIIALGKGTFAEAVTIDRPLTVVGACVAQTIIAAPAGAGDAAITFAAGAAGARVTNLRVAGDAEGIRCRSSGAPAVVEAVEVSSALRRGVTASGRLDLREVAIRDTRSTGGDQGGEGLHAGDGARVSLTRAVLERNRGAGIAGELQAVIELADVVVRDTHARDETADGVGVSLLDGVQLTARRLLLERNRHAGLTVSARYANATPCQLDLVDLVVRDTIGQQQLAESGFAVLVDYRGALTIRRGLLARNRSTALMVRTDIDPAPPPRISIDDVVVRDTGAALASGLQGTGITVLGKASVHGRRLLLERNSAAGIELWAAPSEGAAAPTALFEDVVVRETRAAAADGAGGDGLFAADFDIAIRRGLFARNRTRGVSLGATTSHRQAALLLEDVTVRDTLPAAPSAPSGASCHGLAVSNAAAKIDRCVFAGNVGTGILATGDAELAQIVELELRRSLVWRGQPRPSDGALGDGLATSGPARVTVEQCLFSRNHSTGLYAVMGPQSELQLTDLTIRDTRPEADGRFGVGALVLGAGAVAANRVLLERNRETGLLLFSDDAAHPLAITLSDVTVRHTESQADDGTWGAGIAAYDCHSLVGERLLVEHNRAFGVLVTTTTAGAPRTDVALSDVTIDDTARAACAAIPAGEAGSCNEPGFTGGAGSGLVLGDAAVRLSRFDIGHSAVCGVQVLGATSALAAEGAIHHNAIGLNVQSAGFDLEGLLNATVWLFANDINFSSAEIPVPDPSDVLESIGDRE